MKLGTYKSLKMYLMLLIFCTYYGFASGNLESPEFFSEYRSFANINRYLTLLEMRHPSVVTVKNMSIPTFEGRMIPYVLVQAPHQTMWYSNQDIPKKPLLLIEGGIHSREWITQSSALMFLEELLTRYSRRFLGAVKLLANYDVIVVPVLNPDGYEQSRTEYRMQRKNMKRWEGTYCVGVDINRNFPTLPGVTNSDEDCHTETYQGPFLGSEEETKNMMSLVQEHLDELKMYISLHSYSQEIILPFGATTARPPCFKLAKRVAVTMRKAFKKETALDFDVGTVFTLGKGTSIGSSIDWVTLKKPEVVALALEFPPKIEMEDPGFELPPSKIKQLGSAFYKVMEAASERLSRMSECKVLR